MFNAPYKKLTRTVIDKYFFWIRWDETALVSPLRIWKKYSNKKIVL